MGRVPRGSRRCKKPAAKREGGRTLRSAANSPGAPAAATPPLVIAGNGTTYTDTTPDRRQQRERFFASFLENWAHGWVTCLTREAVMRFMHEHLRGLKAGHPQQWDSVEADELNAKAIAHWLSKRVGKEDTPWVVRLTPENTAKAFREEKKLHSSTKLYDVVPRNAQSATADGMLNHRSVPLEPIDVFKEKRKRQAAQDMATTAKKQCQRLQKELEQLRSKDERQQLSVEMMHTDSIDIVTDGPWGKVCNRCTITSLTTLSSPPAVTHTHTHPHSSPTSTHTHTAQREGQAEAQQRARGEVPRGGAPRVLPHPRRDWHLGVHAPSRYIRSMESRDRDARAEQP